MNSRSSFLRVNDMLDAMEIVQRTVSHGDFQKYENDRASQMVVERGLEIVSEASRHLPIDLKERHPEIPWRQVADIGNKLRHEYNRLTQVALWDTARLSVPELMVVCKAELERELRKKSSPS
jgi:uncharacterized protein with HEPN domain